MEFSFNFCRFFIILALFDYCIRYLPSLRIMDVIPLGFTGPGASYSNEVDLLTPPLAQVVKEFFDNVSMKLAL